MKRIYLTVIVLFIVFNGSCSTFQKAQRPLPKKPNVIIILSDDAGYADFGFQGLTQFATPNLDKLAAEGITCTNGYVSASVCAPSRAGLLTGRYQQRFGHEFNGPEKPEPGYTPEQMGLDVSEKTIGAVMQDQGYKTMAIGKWHLGDQRQFHPLHRGFDEFFGFLGGSRSYFPLSKNANANQILRRGDEPIDETEQIKYTTDALTDAALDFIKRNQQDPFFLYLAYNAVHTPMEAKEQHLQKLQDIRDQNRRIYAAMTTSLDENVGRLCQMLNELKLEENTLVIFLNDNGGATNNGSDNGKLRGMKGSKWEGGIRVPFILRWPGVLPAGKQYDQPVISLDLFPTALAASGGTWTGNKKLDGVNLLPYLQGKKQQPPHEILFWRRGIAAAVRKGPWKLIRSQSNPILLFNLKRDPGERMNLFDQHPEIVKELSDALAAWETELAPPKWKEGQKWERNQIHKHRMDVNTRALERAYP